MSLSKNDLMVLKYGQFIECCVNAERKWYFWNLLLRCQREITIRFFIFIIEMIASIGPEVNICRNGWQQNSEITQCYLH